MDEPTVLEDFSIETFAGHVGDGFWMDVPGSEPVSLELTKVQPLGSETAAHPGGRTPFALEFVGPAAPVFPQATYRFQHEKLGSFEIFIVPLGPADGGIRYEAIFT